jgi:transcription factor STE12
MAHMMYSQHHATMAPPQKPETFMLSSEAQQSLPQDAQVALQQVDNCKSRSWSPSIIRDLIADKHPQ